MDKPNIILVVVDALRDRNLNLYGYHLNTMPNLSRLAKEGIVFKNAYSTTDQTDPSFTTIMSGLYPPVHGITKHGPDLTTRDLHRYRKSKVVLISRFLRNAGYYTIGIDWLGRWHKKGYIRYGPASSYIARCSLPNKITAGITRVLAKSINQNMYAKIYRTASRLFSYCNDNSSLCVIDAAEQILSSLNKEKPFFMLLHIWDTHTPFDDIPRFFVKMFYEGQCTETVDEMLHEIRNEAWRWLVKNYHLRGIKCVDEVEPRYNAAIYHFDTNFSSFIDFLKDNGLYDNTLIVITGDHGDNLIRKGIFIGHGGLYQRVLRIPLIFLGKVPREGLEVNDIVQHVDIFPTLLEITGLGDLYRKYPVNGKSLMETIETGNAPRPYAIAYSSTAPRRYALINNRYKLVFSPSLRDAIDKYGGIWFNDVVELYDLKKDNDDSNNIARDQPDLVKEMVNKLKLVLKEIERMKIKRMLKLRSMTL